MALRSHRYNQNTALPLTCQLNWCRHQTQTQSLTPAVIPLLSTPSATPPGEGSQNSPSKHPRQPMGLTKDTPELSSSATDSTGVQTQLDTSPDTVSAAPGQPGWPRTSSSSSSLRPAHSLEIRRAGGGGQIPVSSRLKQLLGIACSGRRKKVLQRRFPREPWGASSPSPPEEAEGAGPP